LSFLQSLIQNLPDQTAPAPPPANTENTSVPQPEPQTKPEEKNACWEFLSRHDERVKRTKKAP
jgi:hypothetical protein